jgi:magnesium transporter
VRKRGRLNRDAWLVEVAAIHQELRQMDTSEEVVELENSLRDVVHLAVELVSLWESGAIRKMSALTLIFVSDALIAGIYGMNFVFIPSLDWQAGYPWALGLMFVVAVSLFFVFRRLDWL